jgi:pimeloyl-ACP methyl ester carboxylesterase
MTRPVKHIQTSFGNIAYTEQGKGPPAVFLHGVFLNGYVWRHVIDRVADVRRCIAIDLLAHGATHTPPEQDLSFTSQAHMLEAFCAALGLQQIDLVANDSGGGIAQIFAAHYPHRLRSLTLTNCDTHDNWPPPAFDDMHHAVAQGQLGAMLAGMLSDFEQARAAFSVAYEHPERLDAATICTYLEPLATPAATRNLERWFAAMQCSHTVAVEPLLRKLQVPTLIVWGTGDVFFPVQWAHWLQRTIPGMRRVIELQDAKLFFPEERPDELATALREHWSAVDAENRAEAAVATQ